MVHIEVLTNCDALIGEDFEDDLYKIIFMKSSVDLLDEIQEREKGRKIDFVNLDNHKNLRGVKPSGYLALVKNFLIHRVPDGVDYLIIKSQEKFIGSECLFLEEETNCYGMLIKYKKEVLQ